MFNQKNYFIKNFDIMKIIISKIFMIFIRKIIYKINHEHHSYKKMNLF